MKKIILCILVLTIISIPFLTFRCKKENSWDISNLKNFTANISNFESLAIEQVSEDNGIKRSSSHLNIQAVHAANNENMQLTVKHKGEDEFNPVEFIVHNNNDGTLTGPNGHKLKIGDILTQNELPIILDKLCVMYDLTLISFVKDPKYYNRPNNMPMVWESEPLYEHQKKDREYDFIGYESNKKRASFIIDNYTGKMYYIQPGDTINIDGWGYLEELVSLGTDGVAKVIPATRNVSSFNEVLRDCYGQNIVPSNVDFYDETNKVLYYSYDIEKSYIRTMEGKFIYIKYSEPDYFNSINTIEEIYEIGENFTYIPLDENYEAESINITSQKLRVGGTFINKIKDGYIYRSAGYERIEMKRLGFLDNKTDINLYFGDAYKDFYTSLTITGSYGVTLWDYDTILVYIYDQENKVNNWYYANVFENNEFDGSIETLNKLHPLLLGCDTSVTPDNFGLAYLQEKTRFTATLKKDEIIYKIVENIENNNIIEVVAI